MRYLILLTLCGLMLFLCSCIDITNIDQPKEVNNGGIFETYLTCLYVIDEGDQGEISGQNYWGVMAIMLPDDWKVVNTDFSGTNSGSFSESESVRALAQVDYPAKEGYHWVGYVTYDAVTVSPDAKELRYRARIKLQAGKTTGEFQPDYKVGISEEPKITSTSITWGETTVELPTITVK